jgi:hypothetical protein
MVCGLVGALAGVRTIGAPAQHVEVIRKDSDRRVDVLIDGQPFTSYIWPATLKKPVLFPIRSAHGTVVTRGFPLAPRPAERVDHPHHVGLWFNYGDVNGIDFWNNSDAIPEKDRGKMGTIVHRSVEAARGGKDTGELVTTSNWLAPDRSVVLDQKTRYIFRGDADTRSIDLVITLTAHGTRVAFPDNKEGVLGMRVARALEEPADKPELLTDERGRPMATPTLDNAGVNGLYLTSEGKKGSAVWGTRGKWCLLSGTVGQEPIAIAIFDHPENPGYPTYWHARGYGLFAANPLGQKALSDGKETLNFALDPHRSVTFRYRIAVISGAPAASDIDGAWRSWSQHQSTSTQE